MIDCKVKAGIIGFGYMGHFHLKRSREVKGIEIVGVYDIDREKLEEAKTEGLIIYATLEEMLEQAEIELIIICTPNNYHRFYAVEALRAKKNVLCEKPATMDAKEAEEIIGLAMQNKNFLLYTKTEDGIRTFLSLKALKRVKKSESSIRLIHGHMDKEEFALGGGLIL